MEAGLGAMHTALLQPSRKKSRPSQKEHTLHRNDCMIAAVMFRSFPQTEAATVEAELACAQHWGVVRLVVKELSITARVQLFDIGGLSK